MIKPSPSTIPPTQCSKLSATEPIIWEQLQVSLPVSDSLYMKLSASKNGTTACAQKSSNGRIESKTRCLDNVISQTLSDIVSTSLTGSRVLSSTKPWPGYRRVPLPASSIEHMLPLMNNSAPTWRYCFRSMILWQGNIQSSEQGNIVRPLYGVRK